VNSELDILTAGIALRSGELSAMELTRACLTRIDEVDAAVNAFVDVYAEEAMAAARQAQEEIARGLDRGPLHGIPIAVKDLFDVAGHVTAAGSQSRADALPSAEDAHSVGLLRKGGAVIVGKTHTHEFAFGSTTPQTRNPWDLDRVPGGSSGGSAAALALDTCLMALGTDTAGSIRMPAALCGVVGMKPTYGRVSKSGIVPLSWSLDHAGPLARYVGDAAAALQVMAGHDVKDVGSHQSPVPDYLGRLGDGVEGLTVAVPTNHFSENLSPAMRAAHQESLAVLEGLGAMVLPVELPLAAAYMGATFAIMMAEASAYHRDRLVTHGELYTEDVRTLLEAGLRMPAVDYVDAQRARGLFQAEWHDVLSRADVVVVPTLPTSAALADSSVLQITDSHVESIMNSYVRLSCPANLTGLPALSVPCGVDAHGLPLGLQIIGRPFDEATVLQVGAAFEQATAWHRLRPPSPQTYRRSALR
jgi:aspartyl-tRNA(Asn)/glutamyl-tRNA(Gln) amidotransferase subunit A